jgi:DNA uptake protein ComE-like DNA-binding protein
MAYRASHGTFNSLEELKEIKGIGANRVEKLEEIFFVP